MKNCVRKCVHKSGDRSRSFMANVSCMKINILLLIISTGAYALAFQFASFLFAQYMVHFNGPVLPIVALEQTIIPFIFGYYVYKYLNISGALSPLLVLLMPVTVILVATVIDIIKGENVTIYEHTTAYLVIASTQFIFITIGAYVQFWNKQKAYS